MEKEITIPEGFEATIDGDKIILTRKESENERIRKALVDALNKNLGNGIEKYGTTLNAALAWLEKQGQQKLPIEKLPSEMKSIGESLGFTTQEECDEYNQMVSGLIMSDEEDYNNIDPHFGVLINKVESKFKIEKGKWYVCTQTFVLRGKVVIIKGQTYQAEKDNVIKGENGCRFIDRHDGKASDYFRPWTLDDAKPGDVLYFNNDISGFHSIGLFKRLASKNEINGNTYRCYARYGGFNEENRLEIAQKNDELCHFGTEACPATKEQHDTLMKAMTEAGYIFDFEKKELKKIDNEEVNGEDYGIDSLYHAQRILEKTLGSVDGYQSDDGILEHKCAITAVKKLYKQKPAKWSEEDELNLKQAIYVCHQNGYTAVENWLKSLKKRYTWKPSDGQMEALADALSLAKNCGEERAFDLRTLYEQLKKLKGE